MIPHNTSLKVYRFQINVNITLEDFAFRTPNCVLSNESAWRCTYYGHDYTVNIFDAKKVKYPAIVCMAFTKSKTLDSFDRDFEKLFGKAPEKHMTTLINWVEKFYTPCNNVNLEGLFDDLNTNVSFASQVLGNKNNDTPKPPDIKSYNEYDHKTHVVKTDVDDGSHVKLSMDQQRFCALIVHPFPQESKLAIEVFSSGKLNVPGIPSQAYFYKIQNYINDILVPLMRQNLNDNDWI